MKKLCVSFDKVSRWERYKNTVFNRVNLELYADEIIEIICPGCKDELYHLFFYPQAINEGKINVYGKIAGIPGKLPIMESCTVFDYIELVNINRENPLSAVQLHTHLKENDLWEKRTTDIRCLYPLEQCLLLFCMATLLEPDILVLMDWSNCMNTKDMERFWSVVIQYLSDKKVSIIILSDEKSNLSNINRCFRLKDGTFIEYSL